MEDRVGGPFPWSRIAALTASSASALILTGVLAYAAWWLAGDWDALKCFDGGEPGCDRGSARPGFAAVGAAGWALGAVGVASMIGAFAVSWRTRRPAHLLIVLALCMVTAAVAALLYLRFWGIVL